MRPRTLEDQMNAALIDPWPRALRCRPCLCGHDRHDHSKVLFDQPCLDCGCAFFIPRHRPRDPGRASA